MLCSAGIWFVVNSTAFPVRTVKVKGDLMHVTQQQLDYVVQHEVKGTFFTLNIAAVRDAFSKLPWVKNVTVYRHWPDRVEVALVENVAVARWGEEALLDAQGAQFEAATTSDLPILEGPEGSEKEMMAAYVKFKKMLAPIGMTPTHIWLSPRRSWQIEVNKSWVIKIGREYVNERLARFILAYPQSLAKRQDQQVEYIDLRYSNGFAVYLPNYQPAAGAAKA
jgi:cell division protein FtsQ